MAKLHTRNIRLTSINSFYRNLFCTRKLLRKISAICSVVSTGNK